MNNPSRQATSARPKIGKIMGIVLIVTVISTLGFFLIVCLGILCLAGVFFGGAGGAGPKTPVKKPARAGKPARA